MFVAAQYTQDRGNDFYIGAFAPTKRVFSRCNNSRHCGYRTLPAADCIHGGNHRLSWHMHYWYTAGWRAGWAHNMNSESNVYKLVMTKICNNCGVVQTARPTNFPTARPTNFPTARPTAYPTAYPTSYPTPAVCKKTYCTLSGGATNVYTSKKIHGITEKWDCQKSGNGCLCLCDVAHSTKCTLTHTSRKAGKVAVNHC